MEITALALLFDMDGTLIDSFASANRAWDSWACEVGASTPVMRSETHGKQRPEVVKIVLPDSTDEDALVHSEEVRQRELHDVDDVVALPGSFDLLTSLDADTWAVVTACDREVAEARLNAAGLPIPKVFVTADDLERGKPNPDGFLMAAAALGIAPEDAVVFEDAPAGLEAARRAGMRSVASRFTANHDGELEGALAIVDNPSFVTAMTTDGVITLTI